MVEIYGQNEKAKEANIINNALNEEDLLKEDVNESLPQKMRNYFEKNISVNWKKVDFNDVEKGFDIVQDPDNAKRLYLVYKNKFEWLWLQADQNLQVWIAFDVVTEKNNYYIKFDTKGSSFDPSIIVNGQELLVWDVVSDITVPNEKQKTTDVRIDANVEKTSKRIRAKVEAMQFQSYSDIKEKPEFENTQLTGLNNLSFGKEITKEDVWYSRTISLFDPKRAQYRPVAKAYFDKLWNFDWARTETEYQKQIQTNPLKVLGQTLNLAMWLSSDKKTLQVQIDENNLKNLENRVQAHREKLISYIDQARIAPGSQFNEFDKSDKERPWHPGEKKFLFDTSKLTLDIMNDTYTISSTRKEDQNIRFGFDFADKPSDDKIFIKDLKWKKVVADIQKDSKWDVKWVKNAFDINVDANSVYSVFDDAWKLTIYKSDKAVEKTWSSYPELSGAGAKYVKKETFLRYDSDGKKMEYLDSLYDRNLNLIKIIWELKLKIPKTQLEIQKLDIYEKISTWDYTYDYINQRIIKIKKNAQRALLEQESNELSILEWVVASQPVLWNKIMEIPVTVNDKSEWKLEKVSENIYTDYLIDMKKFDSTKLQKLNLNGDDMKKTFLTLMQKEDIKLQSRWTIKILVDPKTWKYEYFKAKQSVTWQAINLEKDKELYDVADNVMKIMEKRLEIISKVENSQLRWTNNWKDERFEWAVWWGRWLEKSSLTTENKLAFLNWNQNILTQQILWWEWESSIVEYKIKKNGEFGFDIKDSKAVKLEWTWFLKRKLSPKLDIQKYKMSLEVWNEFKLKLDPVE